MSLFEGVWALHTTVIRAADQREVGNLVRIRAPKSTDAANFAEMLRFPTFLLAYLSRHTRFPTKSLKRRAPTAVARLVCVEMIASETPERRRSNFLNNVCFCALVRLDYTHFCKKCMLSVPLSGSITLACVLLSCFTGQHFSNIDCSGVSLATISLTSSVLMLRGARPARP